MDVSSKPFDYVEIPMPAESVRKEKAALVQATGCPAS